MGAMATPLMVQREVGMEAVLHYCYRDRNLPGMMSDLLGAAAMGLRNLLLITGDRQGWVLTRMRSRCSTSTQLV